MTTTYFIDQVTPIPANWLNDVNTKTYADPEIALLASSAGANNVGYQPAGTGAVATTVQSKLRESVSVKDFGAVGDFNGTTGTDNYSAFLAAINSFPTTWDGNGYSFAGEVKIPPGKYYFSQPLILTRQVKLTGSGSPAGNALSNCQLWFPDNVNGIVIHYEYQATPLDSADGSLLSGFSVSNKGGAGGTLGSGVVMNARAELRNVLVSGFRVDGIQILANTGVAPYNNANNWHIENCVTMVNGRHGLFVQGADVNAGTCIGLDSRSNAGVGIYDPSFLGNTYLGCHTAANVTNGYKADNTNGRNLFVGCYTEGGETSSIVSPSMVVGGILAAAGSGLGTAQVMGEGIQTSFTTTNGTATLGTGIWGGTNGALMLKSSDEPSFPFRVKYKATGRWAMDYANSGNIFYLYNQQATTTNGFARNISNGAIGFPTGFYLGDYDEMRSRTLGTAAPVAGTWVQGDIVYNKLPTSGGYIGWVCTVAGTPGTWKTYGLIS